MKRFVKSATRTKVYRCRVCGKYHLAKVNLAHIPKIMWERFNTQEKKGRT